MADVGIQVDASKAMLNIGRLISGTPGSNRKAEEATAREILRLASEQVPHDQGTLEQSGNVQPDVDGTVVGFNTKYAARLHEHPEYHFQRGRKGKYLEDPIRDNADALGIIWADQMGNNLLETVK